MFVVALIIPSTISSTDHLIVIVTFWSSGGVTAQVSWKFTFAGVTSLVRFHVTSLSCVADMSLLSC